MAGIKNPNKPGTREYSEWNAIWRFFSERTQANFADDIAIKEEGKIGQSKIVTRIKVKRKGEGTTKTIDINNTDPAYWEKQLAMPVITPDLSAVSYSPDIASHQGEAISRSTPAASTGESGGVRTSGSKVNVITPSQKVKRPVGRPIDWTKRSENVTYFFDQIRFGMVEATSKSLDEFGKILVRSVKASMVPGRFRVWRSKRERVFKGMVSARTQREVMEETGLPREEAKRIMRRTRIGEALKVYKAGTAHYESGFKNGRIRMSTCKKGGKGLLHWSSKPGMAPAPDTETLKKSIKYEIVRVGDDDYKLRLIADTPYARVMELGSAKQNIAPRPYLRKAIEREKNRQTFIKLLGRNCDEFTRIVDGKVVNIPISENVFRESK